MMKIHKLLAGLGLLATALPSVVFAQVINRPSNDRPTGTSPAEGGGNTVYIIVAVVVVAVVAFLFFRSKKKD